jgi:hypothetical protein
VTFSQKTTIELFTLRVDFFDQPAPLLRAAAHGFRQVIGAAGNDVAAEVQETLLDIGLQQGFGDLGMQAGDYRGRRAGRDDYTVPTRRFVSRQGLRERRNVGRRLRALRAGDRQRR